MNCNEIKANTRIAYKNGDINKNIERQEYRKEDSWEGRQKSTRKNKLHQK